MTPCPICGEPFDPHPPTGPRRTCSRSCGQQLRGVTGTYRPPVNSTVSLTMPSYSWNSGDNMLRSRVDPEEEARRIAAEEKRARALLARLAS